MNFSIAAFSYEWMMWREEMRRFMRQMIERTRGGGGASMEEEVGDALPQLATMEDFNQEEHRLSDNSYWRRRVSGVVRNHVKLH